MNKKIIIQNPCNEDVNTFKKCGSALYCSLCQKHVHDLRKTPVSEAQHFVQENPDACIVIHPRHTKTHWRYSLVNKFENLFLRMGMKRSALLAGTVMLFMLGCRSRTHVHPPGGKSAVKEYKTLKD
jgi:hypothetical protein